MAKYKALINLGNGIVKDQEFDEKRLSPFIINSLLRKGRIELVKEKQAAKPKKRKTSDESAGGSYG